MTDTDILIIGGGVNGTAIARDAAGRGLSVVLCEMNDLASGTSSASTKLIHGGLRYLEHREFSLVKKSLIERQALLDAAPHIIKPMRFVLPHLEGMRPRWKLRLGLYIYDRLGPKDDRLPRATAIKLDSGIEAMPLKDELTQGFVYSDCWVDDSRLVILNAVDAAERGAEILPRTKCTALAASGDHWQATLRDGAGGERTVQARSVVNAAGPWVGDVLGHVKGRETAKPVPLRLVKGSHIIVPRLHEAEHAYIFQNADGRILFAIPYEGRFTLLGTTEEPFSGDPSDASASEEEIDYLCTSASAYFKTAVNASKIVHMYSGVRPLFDDRSADDVSAITRDYVFDLESSGGAPPLLNIYGGKLTTSRKLAEHAVEQLKSRLGFDKGPWTEGATLPGGDIADGDFDSFLSRLRGTYPWMTLADMRRMARAYGTRVHDILGDAESVEDLGMAFGQGLCEAELKYLQAQEWATTLDDVLWRRSKLGLHIEPDRRQLLEEWFKYGGSSKPEEPQEP